MNKFVKLALVLVLVIIVIGALFYAKLFVIGNNNYQNISVSKVTVSDSAVNVYGLYTDSSSAYKDYKYTLVGTELYIEVTNVKVSSKYSKAEFELNVPVNGLNVNNVYLSDGKSAKVIYSKWLTLLVRVFSF